MVVTAELKRLRETLTYHILHPAHTFDPKEQLKQIFRCYNINMKHIKNKLILSIALVVSIGFVATSCEEPHSHSWESRIETMPTCEEEGVVVKTCILCGATEKEPVAATGHKEGVEKTVVEAGCLTEGKIDIVCPDCGKIYESKTIPAKAHVPGTLEITKAATCTEPGTEESVCTVCGTYIGLREIPAKGHNDQNVIRSRAVEPTCEEEGTINKICPDCLQTIGTEKIPALGHIWGDTVIDTDATCTTEGIGHKNCSRDNAHVQNVTIPKAPHNFSGGESTTVKEATCTETGLVETKCTNCDETLKSSIPALGHQLTEEPNTIVSEASEFANGIGEWKCQRKGCDYSEQRMIPALHVHRKITDAPTPFDIENIYGNNILPTCSSKGKIFAYCTCFVDEEGNFSETAGAGKMPYMLIDPETGEPYYQPYADYDAENHGSITETLQENGSYFAGKIYVTKCVDCGKQYSYRTVEEGKAVLSGLWEGSASYQYTGGSTMTSNFKGEFYENGKAILYQDLYMGPDPADRFESTGDGSIKRTVDGRWISTWSTLVHDGMKTGEYVKSIKILANDTEYSYINVLSDNPSTGTIEFDLMMQGIGKTIERQELPSNKGILTIDADGLSTFGSFSKAEDGTDIITVASGTPVSLAWVDLADTPASSWTWIDNGSQVSEDNSYAFTEAATVDHTVTCTVAGETHKVIIKFVNPS